MPIVPRGGHPERWLITTRYPISRCNTCLWCNSAAAYVSMMRCNGCKRMSWSVEEEEEEEEEERGYNDAKDCDRYAS